MSDYGQTRTTHQRNKLTERKSSEVVMDKWEEREDMEGKDERGPLT